MGKKSNPCYGCDKRQKDCHSYCEEYGVYKQANLERAELIRQKKAEESMMIDVRERAIQRTAKEKRTQSAWKGT